MPQKVSETGHAHAPDMHSCPAPQGRPHAPQFCVSFSRSEHPLVHAVRPPEHAHTPETHGSPEPHAFPHVPQLSGSSLRYAQ